MLLIACIFLLIALAGLLGNGLTLILLSKFQFSVINRSTKYLLMNQSAIDGCAAPLLFTSYYTWGNILDWQLHLDETNPAHRFVCNFWINYLLFWALISTSSLNLMDIALERIVGAFMSEKYKWLQEHRLVLVVICLFPWILGTASLIPTYADKSIIVNGTCFDYALFPHVPLES